MNESTRGHGCPRSGVVAASCSSEEKPRDKPSFFQAISHPAARVFFHFPARTALPFPVSGCERQLALLDSIQLQPSVWTAGGIGRGSACPAKPARAVLHGPRKKQLTKAKLMNTFKKLHTPNGPGTT